MKYVQLNGSTGTTLDYKQFAVTADGKLLCLRDYKNGVGMVAKTLDKGQWIQLKTTSKTKAKPFHLNSLLKPSAELAAIVGPQAQTRVDVIKKIWKFIKDSALQDAVNRRQILVGKHPATKAIFKRDKINMFEMTKIISQHLK